MQAPVGPATFAITLFDGPNATGNTLATGQTSANVVSGSNTISVVLGGIVSSLTLVADRSNFTLGTANQTPLHVHAFDASGAEIVGTDTLAAPIRLTTSGSGLSVDTADVDKPGQTVQLSYGGSNSNGGSVTATTGAIASTPLVIAISGPVAPQPVESAVPALAFVDSVGVNVHLHFSNTPYYDNYPAIKSLLVGAGIRHIRDGLINTGWQGYYDRLNDLGASGIHSTLITDVAQSMPFVTSYQSRVSQSLEAIEGPNEYDRSGDPQWSTTLANYTRNLYTAVHNTPQTAFLPVIGPSLTSGGAYAQLGDLSAYMDFGNMHDYLAGFYPGNGGYGGAGYGSSYGSIAYNQGAAAQSSGRKPMMATETGYGTTPNTHNAVDEATQGKYVSRLLLEHYLHGVARTFIYQLVDAGTDGFDYYGLLRKDLSPKPAYTMLASLLNVLSGPAGGAPATLSFAISGNTQNLHHLLLHKADGTFYLAYWIESSSYDVDAGATGAPVTVAPQAISVAFGEPVANVKSLVYDAQGNYRASPMTPAANRIALSATDAVSIVSLSAGG
ncbi:MAG: hypothetical protein NVSMB19_01760 [Vulcanimicrobiaceae bacterium]